MENELTSAAAEASREALVEIVKLAQKQGRRGSNGGWKEFLNIHDRKIGSSLSDPAKRPRETLLSFVSTFTDPDDLKLVERVLKLHYNRETLNSIVGRPQENDSAEQTLLRATFKHPNYISKYALPSFDKDWLITNVSKKKALNGTYDLLAVDCEMVLCKDGTDALVKICIVDKKMNVKLDKLVKAPKPVEDYRSEITGVSAKDLEDVSCTLQDVQRSVKGLLSKNTILVGHSLYNDMLALKLDHPLVIDTSFIFKTNDGSTPSLSNLCKHVLGYQLRENGATHNCVEDAQAAMKLVLHAIQKGLDGHLFVFQRDLPEPEPSKLLIHRIPVDFPIENLGHIFTDNPAVEIKLLKNSRGLFYSALATFPTPEEANSAFARVKSPADKDKNGFLQKRVVLENVCVYVRKTAHDNVVSVSESKKASEGEDTRDAKRCKVSDDVATNYLTEINILKEKLKLKEIELLARDKMIEVLRGDLKAAKKAIKKKT